jgi:hypothetical protein
VLKSASPEVAYFLLKQAALPTDVFGDIGRLVIRGLGRLGGSGKITGAPAKALRDYAYKGAKGEFARSSFFRGNSDVDNAIRAAKKLYPGLRQAYKYQSNMIEREMARRLGRIGLHATAAAGAGAAGAGYLGYKALGGGAEPDAVPAND